MQKQVLVTTDDVNNIAKKLDEFSAVLNDREYILMLAILGMAKNAINAAKGQGAAAKEERPQLSQTFREALVLGIGRTFVVSTSPAEDAEGQQQQQQQQQQTRME